MRKLRLVYALLAILSALYSIAVYMVGSGTFSFIIWVFAAIFFGFLYMMDKKNLWPKVPKAIRLVFRIIVATGIVTNNFHVFRGVMIAKRYTDADVTGIAAFTEYQYLPNNMVRETFGILKDMK